MTEQGPDADVPALELRPLGWREADGVARLWRDLLVLAVPVVPGILWLALASEQHPLVSTVVAVGVLAVLVVYAAELLMVRRERVVVTTESVEWWRGRRLRARLQRGPTMRAARYVPRPLGRPFGLIHLALSDGASGFRLVDARWIGQFETIVLAAEVAAPRLTQARARHRMPECFAVHDRLPSTLTSRAVGWTVAGLLALLVASLVAAHLLGAAGA